VKILALVVVALALLIGLSSVWLARPVFEGVLDERAFNAMAVAPRDQAITLAVTEAGSILLVTNADAAGVTAIDISAATGQSFEDAIGAYVLVTEQGLRALYDTGTQARYEWSSLAMPLTPRYPNIAAGTNYRAHAEEVGLDDEPFLFPKLSSPTRWDSDVLPGARLDYEVELCVVPLTEHRTATPARLGYILCGDYTDRWVLVRDLDLGGVMGRTGFPLAKGGESRLPVGPFLVVPHEEDFYRSLQLSLYLNTQLRQQSLAGKMVWSPSQILANTLADCESPYEAGEEILHIGDCERIPAGTLVLTGTPEGVLFKPGTLWNPTSYLQEGDVVTSFGTYLGYMRNEISTNQSTENLVP
jgi:2-keto-4-pentenoate hydratase/2-oxohepta-3-ene-1,7-dioic acid hydratase in catechol pathway